MLGECWESEGIWTVVGGEDSSAHKEKGRGKRRDGWRSSILLQAPQKAATAQLLPFPTKKTSRHGGATGPVEGMHIMKEKLTAVTEHILPKPLTSETYVNPPVILPKEETGYERLLWHQVKQIFLDNKMIIVHRLQKYNIHKNLLPLFVERNFLLVSMETRAWETLHILKRFGTTVLGACINNVILSQQGFVNFAKLPSIITAQGESAGFFSVMTSHTSRLLQRGFVHLCSLLVLLIIKISETGRWFLPDTLLFVELSRASRLGGAPVSALTG
uniref:Large ribosomal subunit protein uL10m n=1 Tax=Pseudonaja textilis TaxID=8673 RepID=A0A670ZG84_PSETE